MNLVEQDLIILVEHSSSPLEFSGVRVFTFLVFCGTLFILILLDIVLSVLRFIGSNYPLYYLQTFVEKVRTLLLVTL